MPFTVADLPAAVAAGASFVELVTGEPAAGPPAFEVTDVDAALTRVRPAPEEVVAPPHTYPRGHRGFEVRGPAGATVMVGSER
jgi:predicted enzyme related to lactoylglutathione lyase